MKLLFYAPTMAPYGGMERHVCELAAAAAAQGHTVRLLTTSDSLGSELRRELAHPLITFRELHRRRGDAGALRKALWLADEIRHARAERWDVIYTNGQSGLAQLVWFAGRRATRIVHHHHNAADAVEQTTWSAPYRRSLKRTARLVGCSRATCAALNAAIGRDDAHYLPYLAACPIPGGDLVERRVDPHLRFGFFGRLIPEKGIDTILALSRDGALNDIEWHIHGAGDAYPPARFAGQPRIVYHGAYHSAEAHAQALLAVDAIALFSTHNEGMPLCLIEGMSGGLPWIATDRGGTRELATSPDDCVVVPVGASWPELVGRVRLLADRIQTQNTSRRRQRAHYDQHFAPDVVAARWLTFFQS